jgi:hypothetical protein
VRNTLIALNTAASGEPDVSGALTSENFNLIGNNSGATITPAQPSDQIGTPGSPINPMLGPLQDNGGPTFTRALLPGSPAIDQGHSSGLFTDQRGFARPVDLPDIPNEPGGDSGDIGAFEFGGTPPTRTPTPPAPLVVISQVYGGGGNTGAPYQNDFIEVFNRGSTSVNISGWSVQYASAAGTSWFVTPLCPSGPCTLAPGQYFLVQEASGGAMGIPLPPADVTGTTAMSATAGKVALVTNTTPLSGSGCPFAAGVVDFIGYGATANCFEGAGVAPAPSNTTADLRAGGGCVDTDNNASNFATGAPAPINVGLTNSSFSPRA